MNSPGLLVTAWLVLAAVGCSIASAQGNQGADSLSQSGHGSGGSGGKPALSAQVGAGTTNGATTGFSGPQKPSAGEVELPDLPGQDLCDSVRDTPAHEDCLSKAVGE